MVESVSRRMRPEVGPLWALSVRASRHNCVGGICPCTAPDIRGESGCAGRANPHGAPVGPNSMSRRKGADLRVDYRKIARFYWRFCAAPLNRKGRRLAAQALRGNESRSDIPQSRPGVSNMIKQAGRSRYAYFCSHSDAPVERDANLSRRGGIGQAVKPCL